MMGMTGEGSPLVEPAETDRGGASTRAVDRALHLLSSVLEERTGNTLTELARDAELSPSTATRLLATLVQHGLVHRDSVGRYRIGVRMKQLAANAFRGDHLYDLAGHHLDLLVEETGETASLGVPLGADEVLYLRQTASTRQVQTIVWTGRAIPRSSTALGKALDGKLGPGGFAVSRRPGSDVVAVAVPVVAADGHTPGAISINAPSYRTTDEDVERFGAALVHHGVELSRTLGASEHPSLAGEKG